MPVGYCFDIDLQMSLFLVNYLKKTSYFPGHNYPDIAFI